MDNPGKGNHLFVYGTLAPGRPNAHILERIGGSWKLGFVKGSFYEKGWGAAPGYPALVLEENGDTIAGFIFSSEQLADHWDALDAFEGPACKRVLTSVQLGDGNRSTHLFVF